MALVGLAALVGLVGPALVASGCTGPDTSVPLETDSVSLETGDTLQVEFGSVNPSIGDSWHLVGKAHTDVLTDLGDDFDSDAKEGEAGVGGELTWQFEAAQSGTTTLRFQYCYRSSPPNCEGENEPAPEPEEITVRVQ